MIISDEGTAPPALLKNAARKDEELYRYVTDNENPSGRNI
jgi:hypothetical protein